jgi:hypothetical protein
MHVKTYLPALFAGLICIAALLVAGCTGETVPEGAITGTGMIMYFDLEGGFYGIVADDGERYLPLNLPEDYRQDGIAVRFTVVEKSGLATIYQWGTPVEIVSIGRI